MLNHVYCSILKVKDSIYILIVMLRNTIYQEKDETQHADVLSRHLYEDDGAVMLARVLEKAAMVL